MADLREHSENLVLGCLNGSLSELTRPDPIRSFGTHYRIAELSDGQNYQINYIITSSENLRSAPLQSTVLI